MGASANYKVAFLMLVSVLCAAYAEEALLCTDVNKKMYKCIYGIEQGINIVYSWKSGPAECQGSLGCQIRDGFSIVENRTESTQEHCCSPIDTGLLRARRHGACICLKDINTTKIGCPPSTYVNVPVRPSINCSSVA